MMRKVRDQPETAWVEPDQWSQWWQLGLQPKTDNTLRLNELKSCSIHQVMCLRKLRYRPNLNFPVNIQMTQRSHDGVAEPVSRPQVCRCRELKLQVSKRQPRNLKDFIPIKRSGPDSRWDVRKPRDQLQETSYHCACQHGFSKSSNDTQIMTLVSLFFCGFLVDIQFELTLKVRDCSFLGKWANF